MVMASTASPSNYSAPLGATVLTGPPMATALTLPFMAMSLTVPPPKRNGVNHSVAMVLTALPHGATASTVPPVANDINKSAFGAMVLMVPPVATVFDDAPCGAIALTTLPHNFVDSIPLAMA